MDDDELTPEGLEAWDRWVHEVELRSAACVQAAVSNWGAPLLADVDDVDRFVGDGDRHGPVGGGGGLRQR